MSELSRARIQAVHLVLWFRSAVEDGSSRSPSRRLVLALSRHRAQTVGTAVDSTLRYVTPLSMGKTARGVKSRRHSIRCHVVVSCWERVLYFDGFCCWIHAFSGTRNRQVSTPRLCIIKFAGAVQCSGVRGSDVLHRLHVDAARRESRRTLLRLTASDFALRMLAAFILMQLHSDVRAWNF